MEENDPMAQWPTGRLLSTAARLVEHAWAEALEKLNLSHAGLIVLHLLDDGALSQTELAHRARVEVQTMSRTLERLERASFVERQKHPDDGRRHVVTRTSSGEAAWLAARTLEADLFPAVSDNPALRTALLEVISTTAADRWS
jgi:DNA-binding MarR family transcriptional regulator